MSTDAKPIVAAYWQAYNAAEWDALRGLVAEEGRVAVRWVARATHTGSLFGEIATGRPIAIDGATIHRVVDGRIAEDWEVMNEGALRDQLAAEPSATA